MAFDSRLFVAGVTLLVYFAAVATTAASGNSLLQFDLLTQQLMEPAAAAVSSISIAAMRCEVLALLGASTFRDHCLSGPRSIRSYFKPQS